MCKKPSAQKTTSKHGFNLIESAIILAIVGLVIGGIWIAAATVNKKNLVNKDSQLILTAITRLQSLTNHQATTMNVNGATAVSLGLIPAELQKGATNAYSYTGGTINFAYTPSASNVLWSVSFYEFPVWACIELGSRISTSSRVSYIGISDEGWSLHEFQNTPFSLSHITPVTPAQISSVLSTSSICNELTIGFF